MNRGKNTWSGNPTGKAAFVFLPFTSGMSLFRKLGMGLRTENSEHIHFEIVPNFKVNIACKQRKILENALSFGAKSYCCDCLQSLKNFFALNLMRSPKMRYVFSTSTP